MILDNLDFTQIPQLLQYDKTSPLIFSSGLFLFLFFIFLIGYVSLIKLQRARIIYVILFSLFFYYKSSGLWFALLIFTATSDFIIARRINAQRSMIARKFLLALSVIINLGMLSYFKYFNFLIEIFIYIVDSAKSFVDASYVPVAAPDAYDIFLPVGISFFTFQSMSYVIDVYRKHIPLLNNWFDYLFYVSFFPQLVAGPIVRAKEFIPQIYKPVHIDKVLMGEALFLIICGLFKKVVISDYISLNFVDRIFDAPLLYSGFENLLGIYGYALQIYCDFSGYSDMAIGIALLLGFRFNINFDAPYKSASITEFWRRWHISLSSWLKDYLYISLGGNRKGKLRTYINLFLTMLLGGLWHGASLRFIIWGALHGVALAFHKVAMSLIPSLKTSGKEMSAPIRALSVFITFNFVCFAWIFFRAGSMQTVYEMLSQIAVNFHPELIPEVLSGYKSILFLMIGGYILHLIPGNIDEYFRNKLTSMNVVTQSLIVALLVFIVYQVKTAGVQPFIYFQF